MLLIIFKLAEINFAKFIVFNLAKLDFVVFIDPVSN